MKNELQLECTDYLATARTLANVIAALILLAGCGQHTNSNQAARSNSGSQPSVTLSAGQLSAIKIAPTAPYLFHNEKEATGSVNFAEDPSIVQAESTVLSAAASAGVAEKELERAQNLYSTRGVSERELEQATSDQQTTKAALDAARSALLVLGKTDSQVSQILAIGKVSSLMPQRQGFKWVVANITEGDAPSLKVGQSVRVRVDAVPNREFLGSTAEIYAVVDPTLHRVSVRSEVSDTRNELRSGMLADVMIQVGPPMESLSVLANGVVREGDGTMTAWVTTDRQHFFQKNIEIGKSENGRVQILEGLQNGQLVVTDGAVLLDSMLLAPTGD
jgi:cobalt-zinc-cadmium efflux system membrane fusion protein